MPTEDDLRSKLKLLGSELDVRAAKVKKLDEYRQENGGAIPPAIKHAKVTNAYKMLMSLSSANYAKVIVKAAASKMRVGGIKAGDKETAAAAWDIWEDNRMDAEFRRATDNVLAHGRAFAIVRPNQADSTKSPEIILEDASTVIVEYAEGSRYERVCALRRWQDNENFVHGTLYYPDATYQLKTNRQVDSIATEALESVTWEINPDPIENPFNLVPAVEIATNGGLKAGRFGSAEGDYETELGLIDRINTLEFLRLVIAFTASFPVRVVIGDKILLDDDDKPIAPFELGADIIAQLEDPNAKLEEFKEADLKAFGDAIDRDTETLAGITGTPFDHFKAIPIQNVNAEALRAAHDRLNSRVGDHLPFVGEGAEEFLRVAMLMQGKTLPQKAKLQWISRESYSLAERADAAVKLGDILPWQVIAERVLDMSQEEINQAEILRGSETLNGLLTDTSGGNTTS
jgi:hypothetical protein